jgi:histidine racemase
MGTLHHLVIARPGGNDTALVFDAIPKEDYKVINAALQKRIPTIEQVMFVRDCQKPWVEGCMAGGEFCGNATRALGYYLLGGKDGSLTLSISGADAPLTVQVKDGMARASMPIFRDIKCVRTLKEGLSIVRLSGIVHMILEQESAERAVFEKKESRAERKELACQWFDQYNLRNAPAAGVMLLSTLNQDLWLKPYVYVPALDTFYDETACGSGSVAVGLLKAKQQASSIQQLKIMQPSGLPLYVRVDWEEPASYAEASLEGPVDILFDGPFFL